MFDIRHILGDFILNSVILTSTLFNFSTSLS